MSTPNTPKSHAANTDEKPISAVSAVGHSAVSEISAYDRLSMPDRRFVDYYVRGKSGGVAYRLSRDMDAGNKTKRKSSTYRVRAHQLLAKPEIRAAIDERSRDAARTAGVNTVQVLRETQAVGFSDARRLVNEKGDFLPLHQLDPTTAAAIDSLEITGNAKGWRYRVRFRDKLKALDLLGRGTLWGMKVELKVRA